MNGSEKTQFKKGHIPWKKGRFKEKVFKDCAVCFKPFAKNVRLSSKQWEKTRYCSLACTGVTFAKVRQGISRGKLSLETRRKMSEGIKRRGGRIISEQQRKDISETLRGRYTGDKSPSWKGGITSENHKIRSSFEMKLWRKQVFTRDNFTCQACGQIGGELRADHELPFALYPDLRFEVLNGRTLCDPCHKKIPTNNKTWKLPELAHLA